MVDPANIGFFHYFIPHYWSAALEVQAAISAGALESYVNLMKSLTLLPCFPPQERISAFYTLGHLTEFSAESNKQAAAHALDAGKRFVYMEGDKKNVDPAVGVAAMQCLVVTARTTPALRAEAFEAFMEELPRHFKPGTMEAYALLSLFHAGMEIPEVSKLFRRAEAETGKPMAAYNHGYLRTRINQYALAENPNETCFVLSLCEVDSVADRPVNRLEAQRTLTAFLTQADGHEIMNMWQALRKESKKPFFDPLVVVTYPLLKISDLTCRAWHAGILSTIERGLWDKDSAVRAESLKSFEAAMRWPKLKPSRALLSRRNTVLHNKEENLHSLTPRLGPSARLRQRVVGL